MTRDDAGTRAGRVREVAFVFLLLGCAGFGGPAAHVTLMNRMLVQRRRWLGEGEFFRLFAACQLIPGPSSTELAIMLGYKRAGWRGLVLGGVCFILPSMGLMLLLAILYQRLGEAPVAQRVLRGVTPVVVGILVWAVTDLGRRLLRTWDSLIVFIGASVVALFLHQPIAVLAGGGALAIVLRQKQWRRALASTTLWFGPRVSIASSAVAVPASLLMVLAIFVKLGVVAFGSGYVLLVFLRSELVMNLHWLTDRQLVDAVAISQATPGPVFTTATFIGFLVAGVAGALLATLGIFLPGFLLVPLLDRLVRLVREHPVVADALSGVNIAALGLILAVAIALGREAVTGPESLLAVVISVAVLLRWPLASPALVVAGAAAGAIFT